MSPPPPSFLHDYPLLGYWDCATSVQLVIEKVPNDLKLQTRASLREAWNKAKAQMLGEGEILAERNDFP